MYLEYSLCSYKQESYWWGWASGGLPRWEALLLWGEDEVVGFVLIGEKKATGESGPSVPHRRLLIRQNQALCGDAWQECEFKQGNFLPDIRFSLQGQSNISEQTDQKNHGISVSSAFQEQMDKALCNQFRFECWACFEQIWPWSSQFFCNYVLKHFNTFCFVCTQIDFSPMSISCCKAWKSCMG